MGFRLSGTIWTIACDACRGRIMADDSAARVGVHGGPGTSEPQVVFVHGECIAKHYPQYFLNQAERSLTVSAYLAEIASIT